MVATRNPDCLPDVVDCIREGVELPPNSPVVPEVDPIPCR